MDDYNNRLKQMADARVERIRRLRSKGMTWTEIGALEGCSRQRAQAIFKRGEKSERAPCAS